MDRPEYKKLKKALRKEDVLILHEIDRLQRSYGLLKQELQDLTNKGIIVMFLNIPTSLVDLNKSQDDIQDMYLRAISNIMIDVLQAMAESEIKLREKRQAEGLESKKERVRLGLDVWDIGRPKEFTDLEFYEFYHTCKYRGYSISKMQRERGCSRKTIYLYIKKYITPGLLGDGEDVYARLELEDMRAKRQDKLLELDDIRMKEEQLKEKIA